MTEEQVQTLTELMGKPHFYGVLGAHFSLYGIREINPVKDGLLLRIRHEFIVSEAVFQFQKPELDSIALEEHVLRSALVSSMEIAFKPLSESPIWGDYDNYAYCLEDPHLQFSVGRIQRVPDNSDLVDIGIDVVELPNPHTSPKYSKEDVVSAYAQHLSKGLGDDHPDD